MGVEIRERDCLESVVNAGSTLNVLCLLGRNTCTSMQEATVSKEGLYAHT